MGQQMCQNSDCKISEARGRRGEPEGRCNKCFTCQRFVTIYWEFIDWSDNTQAEAVGTQVEAVGTQVGNVAGIQERERKPRVGAVGSTLPAVAERPPSQGLGLPHNCGDACRVATI